MADSRAALSRIAAAFAASTQVLVGLGLRSCGLLQLSVTLVNDCLKAVLLFAGFPDMPGGSSEFGVAIPKL